MFSKKKVPAVPTSQSIFNKFPNSNDDLDQFLANNNWMNKAFDADSKKVFVRQTVTRTSRSGNGPPQITTIQRTYDSSLPNNANKPITTTTRSNFPFLTSTSAPTKPLQVRNNKSAINKETTTTTTINSADKIFNPSSYESPFKSRYPATFNNFKSTPPPLVKLSTPSRLTVTKSSPSVPVLVKAQPIPTKSTPTTTKWSLFGRNSSPTSNKNTTGPGKLYIFNHDEFQDPNNEYRDGSKKDVKLLEETFKRFRVTVKIFNNLSLKDLATEIGKITKEDFTRHSSISFAILSHGNRWERISANDGTYSIDDDILFPILRNKTLQNKPKIFIVQACKGDIDLRSYQTDGCKTPQIVPDEIYKFFSSTEGFVSYRTAAGSLFIKCFCEELQRSGSFRNIRDIMELVIKTIKDETKNKQIPSMCLNNSEPYVFGKFT